MQSNAESRFFKWFGTAAAGTLIGAGLGILGGIVIGGGLGGYFWYGMQHDGYTSLMGNDAENVMGFFALVVLAVIGAVVGLIGGGIFGFTTSSIYAALLAKK